MSIWSTSGSVREVSCSGKRESAVERVTQSVHGSCLLQNLPEHVVGITTAPAAKRANLTGERVLEFVDSGQSSHEFSPVQIEEQPAGGHRQLERDGGQKHTCWSMQVAP